jgi:hypothetical protein
MIGKHDDEIPYFYDSHPTEKDSIGRPAAQTALVHYLLGVLERMFDGQICAIYKNFNFYYTSDPLEYPQEPDVAVIKGVPLQWIRSWKVGKTGPAPQVVFEIASWEEWWEKALDEKPARYAQMGVQEYFAYDPNEPPLPRSGSRRLFGWQRDLQGMMRPMTPVSGEALWSTELESWLVPDGVYLRLYDRNGQMRLTSDEAKEKRNRVLEEKLRSLGVDPDQIE